MVASGAGKVPVLECVTAAYRFFAAHVVALLPACAVIALVAGLSPFAAAGERPNFPMMIGSALLNIAAGTVLVAAVLRRAIHGDLRGGVSFGADEIRLLGVAVSMALLFTPLVVLCVLVVSIAVLGRLSQSGQALENLLADPEAFADALAAVLSPGEQFMFSAFILAVFAIAVFISVRLFLVNAATMGERRIVIFQTWRWTAGNFWRVLGAMLLVLVPCSLASSILTGIITAPLAGRTAADLGVFVAYLVYAAQGFVIALSNIPGIALGAELYKGLRPQEFVAK